jgi:hypothetical protein
MAGRVREQVVSEPRHGTYHFFGSLVAERHTQQYKPYRECIDVVGNRDGDNPLDLYEYHSTCEGWSAQQKSGGYVYREIVDWALDYANASLDPRLHFPIPTSEQLGNWAFDTAGGTNPSAASISVPTMIGELKDLPSLVKTWGFTLQRWIANGILWYRFGIRPMINDLKRLYQFSVEVDKLLADLARLQEGKNLRKSVQLRQQATGWVLNHDGGLNSSCNLYLDGQRYVKHTEKVWGSCQWGLTPGESLNIPARCPDLLKKVKGIVFGINSYEALLTAWELFPWSWMIDWFTPIQSFLNSGANAIPLQVSRMCIMRTTTAVSKYVVDTSPQIVYNIVSNRDGKMYEFARRKERWPTALTFPAVTLPALSAGQWSILGSLAALRLPYLSTFERRRWRRGGAAGVVLDMVD